MTLCRSSLAEVPLPLRMVIRSCSGCGGAKCKKDPVEAALQMTVGVCYPIEKTALFLQPLRCTEPELLREACDMDSRQARNASSISTIEHNPTDHGLRILIVEDHADTADSTAIL